MIIVSTLKKEGRKAKKYYTIVLKTIHGNYQKHVLFYRADIRKIFDTIPDPSFLKAFDGRPKW